MILLIALASFMQGCKENDKHAEKGEKLSQEIINTDSINEVKELSSKVPLNINLSKQPPTLESLQHDFDELSWKSFIALNWPAEKDGNPDTTMVIGQKTDRLTVWEHWKSSREVFLKNGQRPTAWGTKSSLPKVCKNLDTTAIPNNHLILSQISKVPNVLDESSQPFKTGPLIDQNGEYTRYEILVNESMFKYIIENQLYNKEGQKLLKNEVNFPSSNEVTNSIGAIMVKSSWIIMDGKYDESKFHTTYALVYNNPDEEEGITPNCSLQKVGLVGFHLGHKIEGSPQWIWSTFEHLDNAPTKGEPHDKAFYNYYNKKSTYPVNEPPKRPWNPANKYTTPSQVERVIPISEDTKKLNEKYHTFLNKAVPGSVWQNYELVSTQWPTNPNSSADPSGVPAPQFLANTTLETYIQGEVPQTSSSCISCHNNATTTNGKFSDFTYLLQRAQKEEKK